MSNFVSFENEYINTDHIVKLFFEERDKDRKQSFRVHIFYDSAISITPDNDNLSCHDYFYFSTEEEAKFFIRKICSGIL